MDALQMLRQDHQKVKEMFRLFDEADNQAAKKAVVDAVLMELDVHSAIEEEIFYPAVARQGQTMETVRHAEEEHHAAETLMKELLVLEPSDGNYNAKFTVLMDMVKEHIEDEESEMLPKAAEMGMDRLDRLGARMAERKAELLGNRRTADDASPRKANGVRASTGHRNSTERGKSTNGRTASKTATAGPASQISSARTNGSGSRKSGVGKTTASGTRARATTASTARRTSTAGGSAAATKQTPVASAQKKTDRAPQRERVRSIARA